jgi:hypothetical protein
MLIQSTRLDIPHSGHAHYNFCVQDLQVRKPGAATTFQVCHALSQPPKADLRSVKLLLTFLEQVLET